MEYFCFSLALKSASVYTCYSSVLFVSRFNSEAIVVVPLVSKTSVTPTFNVPEIFKK